MSEPIRVADAEADEAAWLAARAPGVTATDVHALARGGASTRQRILADKLSGSTFRGNQHTKRGKRREPIIAEWIERRFGIAPNRWLLAHPENPLYLATPDGYGFRTDGAPAGAEIKSHDFGWKAPESVIPDDHYDQCQWGMFVTGAPRWLYVWEVIEADGFPPMQPEWVWLTRDEKRIAELRRAADDFMAWREAGAPLIDADLDPELDAAIALNITAKAQVAESEAFIRNYIAERPSLGGMKVSGSVGQLTYSVTDRVSKSIDFDAWEAADAEGLAKFRGMREDAERIEAEALLAFTKTTTTASTRLVVAAHKTEEA